jgi:hypothetical protein
MKNPIVPVKAVTVRQSFLTDKSCNRGKATFRLSVPFYRQAVQFTCGPACLMMAMKFFQPSLHLTRELEFDIWREANLVECYGASKEGLALAAAMRGFEVYTMGRSLRHSFVDAIQDKIPNIDYAVLELFYNDTRKRFRSMSLKNKCAQIELATIRRILVRSHLPILLTSTSVFGEKEDLPHWVIVTGYGEQCWYLNNPLASSPHTRVSHEKLQNNLGYKGVRCAVVFCGLKKSDDS